MLYGTGKIEPLFKNNAATLLPEPAHRPRNDLLSYQPLYRAAALDWHIRSTHKIALRKDAVTVTPPWYRKFFSLFIVILAFAAVWSMGVFSAESTWVARGIAGTGFALSLAVAWWKLSYDTITLTKAGALTVTKRIMGFARRGDDVADLGNVEQVQAYLRVQAPKNAGNPNRNPGCGEQLPSTFELNVVGDQGERYTLLTTGRKHRALREMRKIAKHFGIPSSEMF
ncbi:MAG: hypothetical protein GY774_27840 [Planctomycetes bacterium]|nr:hypothetical protein [Planctomycetota bacterium]|tara:strand:- start:31767 stop:32444 length:678 start_codon:yes stop_codon:yes gene_type:complete